MEKFGTDKRAAQTFKDSAKPILTATAESLVHFLEVGNQ